MKTPRPKSLIVSLGFIIVLVECVALTSMGLYYSDRFAGEIDKNILSQAQLPGALMNSQLLRYESVADKAVMTRLAGEEFVEGMVVGGDGKIYYASNPVSVGKSSAEIPGVEPVWFSPATREPLAFRTTTGDDDYVVSVTPIAAFEGGVPFFYAYVKVKTNALETRKFGVAAFFILSAGVCIVFTSIMIIWAARRLVTKPLGELSKVADSLAGNNLDVEIGLDRPDEIGGLARSFEKMRDAIREQITRLQEANRNLDESQKRLQAFVDALPDMIFMIDGDGRYIEVLTSEENLLYVDPDSLKGKLMSEILPPATAEAFLGVIKATIETGETQSLEYSLEVPAGRRWFEGRSSRIGGASDRPGRVAWVSRDITERKALEETLRRAKEETEEANRRLVELDRMKSSFLSSVSHELRTPLTSLLGFSKLIIKNFKKHFGSLAENDAGLKRQAERILDDLRIIEHEGERLTRLINDVLDLSKIESGRMEWNDREISPFEVIVKAVDAVSGLFLENPNVRLRMDAPVDLPSVYMDPDRLQQALINLLSNAAKFTESGEVRVEALATSKDVLRICVSDTGKGIAKADQKHVFDAFYQARRGDKPLDLPEGTGLGLSICRQIVERYGGTIRVESEEGRGSAFVIELPAIAA